MAGLASLVAVAALVLAAPGGAPAASFEPQEFEVEVAMEPDVNPSEPDCKPEGDGMVCTIDMDYSVTGEDYKGTVKNPSRDLSGDMAMTCDMTMRFHMVTAFTFANPGDQDVREFSGGGSMECSWFMSFTDGSSLGGTIAGRMRMSKVEGSDPPKMRMDADFTVNVVSGTGVFQDAVGTGSFTESDEFSLEGPPSSGGPSGPPAGASARAARARGAAAGDDGAMKLKLTKGRARVAIATPAKLKSDDKRPLRVVSARGASCQASATKSGRKVSLGSARDSDRDGGVDFKGALARKLGKGSWQIASSCTYPSKGKRVAAVPARKTVRVV